jgi:hypothetical protein
VECPEFRELLLFLQETLQDKDIPHRTKIREAILEAWADAFQALKQELAVSSFHTSSIPQLKSLLERARTSKLHR